MIIDAHYYMSIVVEPGCKATVTDLGHVAISVPLPTLSVTANANLAQNVVKRSTSISPFFLSRSFF